MRWERACLYIFSDDATVINRTYDKAAGLEVALHCAGDGVESVSESE
jgi:hypothetical protein